MKRLLLIFMLTTPCAWGQYVNLNVQCSQGGKSLAVPSVMNTGTNTPTNLVGSYPGATATVYSAGTLTPATLYSNSTGSPLSNPTSCNSTGWLNAYVSTGSYDITFSGSGINTPFTLSAVAVGSGSFINPMTNLGDFLYGGLSGVPTRLAGNATSIPETLESLGISGSPSAPQLRHFPLGNGITVIDVYHEYAEPISSNNISTAMSSAIAACSPGPCEYDLRGFPQNWTVSGIVTPPEFSVIDFPNSTGIFSNGAGFDAKNAYIHFKGESQYNGTYFTRANTSTDYTPYIFTSGPYFIGNEVDHIRFGLTTTSSLPMPATSVDNASAGHTVYHGTFTSCATNACVGREIGIRGFIGHQGNDGYFNVTASTSTTLTTDNAAGVSETPSAVPPMYSPFIVLSGGWGVSSHGATIITHDYFHDNLFYSDLGMQWADSGCTCYNNEANDQFQSQHGGEYWGQQSTDNTLDGKMIWTSNDQISSPPNFLTTATGYGLWLNGPGFNAFNSVIGIESSRYGVICEYCQGNTFSGGLYINNPYASGYGVYNATSGFWLQGPGNVGNVIANSGTNNGTILDTTGANPPVNKYLGVSVLAEIPGHGSGSLAAANIAVTGGTTTPHCTGTCATTRYYNLVPVDSLGNRGAPFAYDSGAGVSNAVTLDSTHYDSLSAPTMTTLDLYSSRCWDILVSTSSATDYSTSLATCVLYSDFTGGFTNNGTLTPVSYTQPLYQIGTVLVGNALIQPAAKTWAGTCSMSSGTTCTFTAAAKFLNGIIYIASDQTGTLAGKCSMNLSTNVVTITASGSNSDSWACTMIGNPN